MIYKNIDKLIAEAMKSQNEVKLRTYRLIKTAFMEYRTSKGAHEIDEATEVQILRKMSVERADAIKMYAEAGRNDLAQKEREELEIIKEYLPAEITEKQIVEAYDAVMTSGIEPIRKNMGMFIKAIKEKYPTADGKLVATIVGKNLK